jgi:hypothetical protein
VEYHCEDGLRSGIDRASWKQSGPASDFPDPMPLLSRTAGGTTLLCDVRLPSGRSVLHSESRCIRIRTHLKGGSRSRIVTIIVARERHWSSEDGPQVHSKGGEVKTVSKIRRPFEFLPLPYLCVALSAQNETGHVHAAGPRGRSGAYGRCAACGRQIEAARLEAIPWARYCLEDQDKRKQTC